MRIKKQNFHRENLLGEGNLDKFSSAKKFCFPGSSLRKLFPERFPQSEREKSTK
jgi:hypothetical protein